MTDYSALVERLDAYVSDAVQHDRNFIPLGVDTVREVVSALAALLAENERLEQKNITRAAREAELRKDAERLRDRGCDDSTVYFYEREFYPLSNFSAFNLRWNGSTYPTSEHAYQAQKFAFVAPEIAERIYRAPSAHVAFKYAEQHKTERRSTWDAEKIDVMREILRAKVEQHEYVRRKLIETGDRELVENSWRDDFWGIGPNGSGQNMIGRVWMEIRAALAETEGKE